MDTQFTIKLCGVMAPMLLLVACGTYKVQDIRAGQSEADLATLMNPLTGRYALPGGGTRLEYATGPQGRFTWMVDLDSNGKVSSWKQVLNESSFSQVQLNYESMTTESLRSTLGRPGEVRGGGWQGGQVWSWRYPTYECFWFQVSTRDDGKLRDGGTYGIDPQCDPGSWGRR